MFRRPTFIFLLSVLFAVVVTGRPAATQPSPPSDGRLKSWAAAYIAGDYISPIRAIEEDLLGTRPHPLVRHVWAAFRRAQGTLTAGWEKKTSSLVAQRLGPLPELLRLHSEGEWKEAYKLAKAIDLRKVNDLMTFQYIHLVADAAGDHTMTGAAVEAIVLGFPESFWAVSQASSQFKSGNNALRQKVADRLGSSDDTPQPYRVAMQYLLDHTPLGSGNEWHLADQWLRSYPDDAFAHRFSSSLALSLKRVDRAEEHARLAYRAYPFHLDPLQMPQVLIRHGAFSDARAWIETSMPAWLGRGRDSEARIAAILADSLIGAGEYGRARATLGASLRAHPDDLFLNRSQSHLEMVERRPAEAIPFARKAVLAANNAPSDHANFMQVLNNANRSDEALAHFNHFKSQFSVISVGLYAQARTSYAKLKRTTEAVALSKEAVAAHSGSEWAHRLLIASESEAQDGAQALVRATSHLAEYWLHFGSQVNELFNAVKASRDKETAIGFLVGARQQLKHIPRYWEILAEHETTRSLPPSQTKAAQIALWREAASLNQKRFWPYENILKLYSDPYDWRAIASTVTELNLHLEKLLPADRGAFLTERVEFVKLRRPEFGRQDPDEALRQSLTDLDDQLTAFGDEELSLIHKMEIKQAFGKFDTAFVDMQRLALVAPDSWYLYSSSAFNLNSSKPGLKRLIFRALFRLEERQPNNGSVIGEIVHRHAMWGGSQIYALALLNRLERVAPDEFRERQNELASIYQGFGLGADAYIRRYANISRISPSQRYVDWFEAARRQAYGEQSRLDLDAKQITIRIFRPDGSVERQHDDPRCGTTKLRQVGESWVRTEFNLNCEIALFERSSGQKVQLTYDSAGKVERMISWSPSVRRELRISYGPLGKPARIELLGVGTLSFTYKDDGKTDFTSTGGQRSITEVLSAFSELSSFIEIIRRNEIPEDRTRDPRYEALSRAAKSTGSRAPLQTILAELELATYLVDNIEKHRGYFDQAEALLFESLDRLQVTRSDDAESRATNLLYRLYKKSFVAGLSAARWKRWNAVVERFFEHAGLPIQAPIRRQLEADPLPLAASAHWLSRSYLDNHGYWNRYDGRTISGRQGGSSLRGQAVLVRRSGEILVGTNQGLFVRQHGNWQRYVVDENQRIVRLSLAGEEAKASSDVLAIVEADDGALWLGTANGLVRVEQLGRSARRWSSGDDGLDSPRVVALAVGRKGLVYVGTTASLSSFAGDGGHSRLLDGEVRFLRGHLAPDNARDDILLVGTKDRLLAIRSRANPSVLLDAPVDDAIVHEPAGKQSRRLVVLQNTRISHATGVNLEGPLNFRTLGNPADLVFSKKIFGLSVIRVEGEGEGILQNSLAVLTDSGISIWHNSHFEHKKLPSSDTTASVFAVSAADDTYAVLSDNGVVYVIEKGQIRVETDSPVFDLVSDRELGATYIARGDRLQIVSHKGGTQSGIRTIAEADVRTLALGSDGSLIFHDQDRIFRLTRGQTVPELLFRTTPSAWPERDRSGTASPTSLLVAKDGAVWSVAGPSIFRWKNGILEEFNYFRDPVRFPLANNLLSQVIETIDGEIWVVASEEGHIAVTGVAMRHGIAKFSEDRFVVINDAGKGDATWFITGYTQIDPGRAIFGTTEGFGEHRSNKLVSFRTRKDVSYDKLSGRIPGLFLGRRGAQIDDKVWLFPSAGGVIGYANGSWFYPDRLNWMLPDQHLANFGARAAHAVATDAFGRIYVGTDRGLLVYTSPGGSAAGFLIANQQLETAFLPSEQEKLRKQRELLLDTMTNTDPRYRVVQSYLELERDIDQLASLINTGEMKRLEDRNPRSGNDDSLPGSDQTRVSRDLEQKRRSMSVLLAGIENNNLALFQLLQLRPVDLGALQQQILPNDIVVQYLPTKDALYIHLVAKDMRNVLAVKVSEQELREVIDRTRSKLVEAARNLSKRGSMQNMTADETALIGDLHWLYERLVSPIKDELEDRNHIYIVPSGSLTYVPFAALVEKAGPKPVYFIERHQISQVPTLYMFQLAQRHRPSLSDQLLILTDPDGSLPSARSEGVRIPTVLKGNLTSLVKTGSEATSNALVDAGSKSRIVHIAAHGVLDSRRPQRSHLMLAPAGSRLEIIDIQLLDLRRTDLVYLSACETGIAGDGQEYTTLAHAFAHAGVPTIIATLWRVQDEATAELAQSFYHFYEQDAITALARAQRAMIASRNFNHPAAWSGLVAFGGR